jgi:lipopolysaccharide export system protein LptC
MFFKAIRVKCAFSFMLLAGATALLAQDPEPAKKGPEPQLRGGFIFNSTRKDGKIEWKVEGSSATFVKPNLIDLRNVRAIHFADDGTSTVATTEKALLDKEKRFISTNEFVTIVTENSVITGTGFEMDQENRKGCLKKDVKVIYKHPEGKGLMQ